MNAKPTLNKPVNSQSQKFENGFKKTMVQNNVQLNEIDSLLSESEFSLKKKIFSLPKMEGLVFSDPKLSVIYNEMAEMGEQRYGYHYNETIMNLIFNDYVLNSPKYLQKYKMSIPKEKKRRDHSGINQLKKAGEKKMAQSGLPKQQKTVVDENSEPLTKVIFLVNEKNPEDPDLFAYFPEENFDSGGKNKTAYSHVGQHSSASPEYAKESRLATPEEYNELKGELEGLGYNLEVLNGIQETTGAAGAGAFSPALGYNNKVDETTTSASSGAYVGPAAWSNKGDLLGSKGSPMRKPIWKGGTIIQESNYLTDPSSFEKYVHELNEVDLSHQAEFNEQVNNREVAVNRIINKTSAFNSDTVKGWDDEDINTELNTLNKGTTDTPNINLMEDEVIDEIAKSKAQQRLFGMAHAVQAGKLSPNKVGGAVKKIAKTVSPEDVEDFASTKHKKLPERVNEEYHIPEPQFLKQIGWLPTKTNKFGGVSVFENDDYGKSHGATYIVGSSSQEQYQLKPYKLGNNENNYLIQQNPKFWMRYIKLDDNNNKIYYLDNDGKYKFLANNRGIEINPNKNWGHNIDNERFLNKMEDMKKSGATFKLTDDEVNEETSQSMIARPSIPSMANYATPTSDQSSNVPTGTQTTAGINESETIKLFEELNRELDAYSIHHQKLIKMNEDRKISSEITRERVISQNPTNFKKDLQHSGTKEIIDIEDELEWKDQQTNVDNPQKLTQDIEKKELSTTKGEALKNVGNSTNDGGDEVPKRNFTEDEQNEVDMYRLGQQDLVYDNKPDQRFEDRMKADMGDKLYKQRQDKLKFRAGAPMYNKDTQPVEDGIKKNQFDKEKSGWNERDGVNESMITGRYIDALNKRHLIDFKLNEVKLKSNVEDLFELDFTGLGNTYNSKSIDNKVIVNEAVVNLISTHKFYTDGKNVIAIKNQIKSLNENIQVGKPMVNEQYDKMKHLLGYRPADYIDTKNVRKNRGF